jgi:uroporphyrinogen-III decarboxylase
VLKSIDEPEVLDRMVELDHRATLRSIELLASAGVDCLSRNGWYETADFWSPAQVERFLGARHRAELQLAHEAGLPVSYTVCTGVMPLIPYLKRQDFDCLLGIEPVLGDQDMRAIARELGADKSIWAGLSAPVHIGRSSPETVRRAVRDFYEVFGHRGTILAAIPSIRPQWPWENVQAMIDEWKQLRGP